MRLLHAYDMILLMDVIEHIDDDVGFLTAALKHLKSDGVVVINVPAHMSFYSKYDEVAGHKRRYNTAGVEALSRRKGGAHLNSSMGSFVSAVPSRA